MGPFWVAVVAFLVVSHVVVQGSWEVCRFAMGLGVLAGYLALPCRCLGWLVRVLFQGQVVRWQRIFGKCRTIHRCVSCSMGSRTRSLGNVSLRSIAWLETCGIGTPAVGGLVVLSFHALVRLTVMRDGEGGWVGGCVGRVVVAEVCACILPNLCGQCLLAHWCLQSVRVWWLHAVLA